MLGLPSAVWLAEDAMPALAQMPSAKFLGGAHNDCHIHVEKEGTGLRFILEAIHVPPKCISEAYIWSGRAAKGKECSLSFLKECPVLSLL